MKDGKRKDGSTTAPQALAEASLEHFNRMSRMAMLGFQAQRVKRGATPSSVVYEEDRVNFLQYDRSEPPKYRTPLVVVFAMVNRPYILDLLPHKSVVRNFLNAGFDVYLVDWGVPTHADRNNTLDDYINGYLRNIVDFVRRSTGSRQVNLLGYCMGGTMSSIFTAPASAARQEPDAHGGGHRLFDPREPDQPLDRLAAGSTSTPLWMPSATALPRFSRACSSCSSR